MRHWQKLRSDKPDSDSHGAEFPASLQKYARTKQKGGLSRGRTVAAHSPAFSCAGNTRTWQKGLPNVPPLLPASCCWQGMKAEDGLRERQLQHARSRRGRGWGSRCRPATACAEGAQGSGAGLVGQGPGSTCPPETASLSASTGAETQSPMHHEPDPGARVLRQYFATFLGF